MANFDRIYERVHGILGLSISQKKLECNNIFSFFNRQLELADIAEHIQQVEGAMGVKGAELPYYVVSLIDRAYLEMETCLLEGAYHSAARSLRWMFETSMIGTMSCVNACLLDASYSKTLDLQQFESMLRKFDDDELSIGRGKRKTIYMQLHLPDKEMTTLFSDLCKYVHISSDSFDRRLWWPNLQFMPEQFDETYELVLRTMDFVFWMESRLCACFNGETKAALKVVFDDALCPKLLPLTTKLVNSL